METGLRRLRYFSVLAEELNFRRTAEKLNITQPALSRAIAQLEQELDVRLVERSNRHVRLTLAGETFAAGCVRLLDGLGTTVDQARKVAGGYAGTLVVGYTDTAIAGELPDLIRAFLDSAPDIHIRLIQSFTERQLAMLRDGTIDIGLATGPINEEGFRSVDVQVDRFVALVPFHHPLAGSDDVSLSELTEFPFVLGDLDAWGTFNRHLFSHCDRAGVRPRIVQTAPESRAILGLVACGLGVSIMPGSLANTVEDRIVTLPIRDLQAQLRTQAVWPETATKPALRHLVEHLSIRRLEPVD